MATVSFIIIFSPHFFISACSVCCENEDALAIVFGAKKGSPLAASSALSALDERN